MTRTKDGKGRLDGKWLNITTPSVKVAHTFRRRNPRTPDKKFDCGYCYSGGYCKYSPFPTEGFKKLCAFSDREPNKNGWKGEKWKICPKMANYEEEHRKKMGLEEIRRRI